jgi:hypothetical protein
MRFLSDCARSLAKTRSISHFLELVEIDRKSRLFTEEIGGHFPDIDGNSGKIKTNCLVI